MHNRNSSKQTGSHKGRSTNNAFNSDEFRPRLVEGAEQLGVQLSESQASQLLCYLALLNKWNKAYNLTSVRDPQEMVVKHILDSLVVAPHLDGNHYIDVGTGPGLPGVVLAIAHPDKQFVLLDSLGKRIRFLNQVEFTDALLATYAKIILLKTYYAEEEFETLAYFITAFKLYIKRNNQLNTNFKKSTDSFLNGFKKIFNLAEKIDHTDGSALVLKYNNQGIGWAKVMKNGKQLKNKLERNMTFS